MVEPAIVQLSHQVEAGDATVSTVSAAGESRSEPPADNGHDSLSVSASKQPAREGLHGVASEQKSVCERGSTDVLDISKTSTRASKLKRFEWLCIPPPPNLTPFQKFLHGVDWKTSPLGPIDGWPWWLKHMVTLVISDPLPAVIYVDNDDGEECAIVYNEAYPALIGNKHPDLQGNDPRIGFAEIWSTFAPILARGREKFETTVGDAQPLLLHRHGFFEETWFSWKFTPVIGPDGFVVASHATVVENTREIILDRRANTLQDVDHYINQAKGMKDFWQKLSNAMQKNQHDVPFFLTYSTDAALPQKNERERSPAIQAKKCTLQTAISEEVFASAPDILDLVDDEGFAGVFRTSMALCEPQRFSADEMPEKLENAFQSRQPNEKCTHGIILPIQMPSYKSTTGFVVIGQNPRRPWDTDYQDFLSNLTKIISSTANRLLLSEQLVHRTKDFKEAEVRFARFTSRAPMGLAIFTTGGLVTYANNFWHQLFQVPPTPERSDLELEETDVTWLDAIIEEDRSKVWDAWKRVLGTKEPITVQFRVSTSRKSIYSNAPDSCFTILCSAFADLDAQGNVQSIMSCLTDVSELKELEEQLRARTHEVENKMAHVLELKKQQEEFIDMTSHEIRNPLSAVLHLAEEVFNTSHETLSRLNKAEWDAATLQDIKTDLNSSIEAAETTSACVLHMKRIVDDILVLSRLDSQLLQVTPVATKPQDLVSAALKMFEAEVRTANMSLVFEQHQSLRDLNIHYLMFDSNRVIQILVNLVGNAIKFTKLQEQRSIKVSMRVSLVSPAEEDSHIDFVPVKADSINASRNTDMESGDGEVVYLSLSVSDTGQGLSPEEKTMLFQRFSQGSKRTHTKYGGSGLGLWISKQLTELHGGQIGLSSMEGQGSNFLFFIKTRRGHTPQESSTLRRDSLSQETQNASSDILSQAASSDHNDLLPENRPLAMRARSMSKESCVERKGSQHVESLHILVVEDNLVNQRIIVKQLRKQGFTVHVANNGQEALDFLKTTIFWTHSDKQHSVEYERPVPLAIILMDLEMPIMDGTTAVTNIRGFERTGKIKAHIPVLAVTANARGEQLDNAMKAGMDSSITKPYRIPEILAKIKDLAFRH